MAQVRLENIFKSYDKHTVHNDLNLTINDGECFVLLGPSGCGKTVMLRMISGFEKPDKGRIFIDNQLVVDGASRDSVHPEKRNFGMVFQDYAVWPHMSVYKNIAYPLKIKGEKPDVIKEKVMEMVDVIGLKGLDQRLPSQLSGGQQQRVAIGRALAGRPSLMLLDEPLNNLDANLREEMRFEIKTLQRDFGMTVIYVTHDQEIGLAIADRIAVMAPDGRIVQIGTPHEIFEQPVNDYVFRFMGVSNFIPVAKRGDEYFIGEEKLPITPTVNTEATENLVAAFRPSDVYFSRSGEGIKAKVTRSSFLGAVTDFQIDVYGHTIRTEMNTYEALTQDLMLESGEDCVINFHGISVLERTEQSK